MSGEQQKGFGQGKITKGCLYLLLGLVGLSFAFLLSKGDMRDEIGRFTAASGDSLWVDFKIWQIFTSPFLEVEFVGVLFQGFMLWMFVPSLERWWGTKPFLKFAAYTSITGILVGTVVARLTLSAPDPELPALWRHGAITGLDPLIYASIIAYGTLFANQQIRFFGVIPMTGRQLTIGITGFMLVMVVIGQNWAEGAAFVSAMVVAWLLTNGNWTPKVWLLKRKQKRLRRHLKVVREGDKPKKSSKPTKWLN